MSQNGFALAEWSVELDSVFMLVNCDYVWGNNNNLSKCPSYNHLHCYRTPIQFQRRSPARTWRRSIRRIRR